MRDELITQAKRVVIKVGSSLIASHQAGLMPERIEMLADEVGTLRRSGREIVLVSSGAIVSGLPTLRLTTYPKTLPLKQAAAAVGQSRLMWAYEHAFERVGVKVAQILLTHDDVADRRRFMNARHTFTTLLGFGILPIVNENDTVSVDEIRFGDNDALAGEVAHLIDADLLVILSDVEGLFTADPRRDPSATLIPLVHDVTQDIEALAGGTTTIEGTGGMATKIDAAKKVSAYGVPTLIMKGGVRNLLPAVFDGTAAGTLIVSTARRLTSRKQWIAYTVRAKGSLTLDDGAVEALLRRGKSLLPSGIVTVTGDFHAGDAVVCLDANGKEVAKGLVNFSAVTLQQIKGLKTVDVKHRLGEQEYEEVIHRDNLVLLSA